MFKDGRFLKGYGDGGGDWKGICYGVGDNYAVEIGFRIRLGAVGGDGYGEEDGMVLAACGR